MQTEDLPVYYTASEAGRLVGLGPDTISQAHSRGTIQPSAWSMTAKGRSPLFTAEAAQVYRDTHGRKPSQISKLLAENKALKAALEASGGAS